MMNMNWIGMKLIVLIANIYAIEKNRAEKYKSTIYM